MALGPKSTHCSGLQPTDWECRFFCYNFPRKKLFHNLGLKVSHNPVWCAAENCRYEVVKCACATSEQSWPADCRKALSESGEETVTVDGALTNQPLDSKLQTDCSLGWEALRWESDAGADLSCKWILPVVDGGHENPYLAWSLTVDTSSQPAVSDHRSLVLSPLVAPGRRAATLDKLPDYLRDTVDWFMGYVT